MTMTDVGARLDQINGTVTALVEQQARIELARERERLRGIKYVRLPLVQKAGSNPFTAGGDTGQALVTPEAGFVWQLRHLVIEGLTAGATPDTVNILRGGRIIWQLNGNQFAQTWGRGEVLIYSGETLAYASVGTFAATGQIIVHGNAEEVPAEMIGKLR